MSIVRKASRWLLLVVLALSLMSGIGCSPKPISKATLDYFYGLANQRYWPQQTIRLSLSDAEGREQAIVLSGDNRGHVTFGDVTVTASSSDSGPTHAVIHLLSFDGSTGKETTMNVRVDDANRTELQNTLPVAFESEAQREERITEEYAAKLKAGDTFAAENKTAQAVVAFEAAQAIRNTDEVRTRLDICYLGQAKDYYAQKDYEAALVQLRLVAFDAACLKEAQELLAIVQAYANKTAWKTAPTVTTADGLSDYLAGKFGPSCQTSLGPTPVTIDVYENTTIDSPEDYSVLVDLDPGFVYDLQSSIKITTAMNHKVSLELKQFMEDIARAAIAAAPGKKLNGCLVKNNRNFALFETYHNWANYAPDGVYATYDSAKVTKFHWQADQDFLYR